MKYQNRKLSTTVGDFDVVVTFNFSPATPDVWYSRNGDPGSPGDPEEIEIISVMVGGFDMQQALTKDNLEDLEIAIAEHMADAYAEEMS